MRVMKHSNFVRVSSRKQERENMSTQLKRKKKNTHEMSSPATPSSGANPAVNIITMSPEYMSGAFIGVFLAMMMIFAVYMMLDIQTSDQMQLGDNAFLPPQKKED